MDGEATYSYQFIVEIKIKEMKEWNIIYCLKGGNRQDGKSKSSNWRNNTNPV
jgi:hypothetical protein